jgi:hypothetical protein
MKKILLAAMVIIASCHSGNKAINVVVKDDTPKSVVTDTLIYIDPVTGELRRELVVNVK